MRRFLVCACLVALLAAPATASAQYRPPPPGHSHVVVGAGYYRPYYYHPFVYPYFYSPFYFGFGAYYNAMWGWYPYAAPYAYGYPYPYPYYYSSWASARIEVKPRDAQVFIDGYYVGVVDQFDGVLQRLDIPGGEHELAIYMPGYHTYREHTLFRPGQTYHYKATLQALAAGSPEEPKPQPDPRAQQNNGPDQYRGGEPPQPYGEGPYRQPPPPQDRQVRPVPPQGGQRGEFGTLSLRVQPSDAVVTIDGERWDSPEGGSRLVVQLPPGTHRVEVRKEGYRPYSTTVEIHPGEPQSLNISLPVGGQ